MDFKTFLIEADLKKYHAIFIGRLQPATLGHAHVIKDLLSKFKSVNIGLSKTTGDAKNPLSVDERKYQIKSEFSSVKVAGVDTFLVFGAYVPEHNKELRKIFNINDDAPLVVALGKEDDRYGALSQRKNYFNVNKGQDPSEESPAGLYGIDLKRLPGSSGKISATDVRNAIANGKDEEAMKIMIGSDAIKKKIIQKIRKS